MWPVGYGVSPVDVQLDSIVPFVFVCCSLRENSVGLFDTSDPDPRKWKKKGVIKDPLWKGE